jgi:hypothetical protein
MFSFTVGDSVEDLMEWYEERLEDDGYELSKSTYSSNGIAGGNLSGKGDDGRTTMTLVFSETKAGTEVGVNYTKRQ